MKEEKPLFIPLLTGWFLKFEDGSKDTEFRPYGPRWNEGTCRVGRKATLSLGYSGRRLDRVVTGFRVLGWHQAPLSARRIYPNADLIAAITLAPTSARDKHGAMTQPGDEG